MSDPDGSRRNDCVVTPPPPRPRRWGIRVVVVVLIFLETLPVTAQLKEDLRPYLFGTAVIQLLDVLSEAFRNLTSRVSRCVRWLVPMRFEFDGSGSRRLVIRWA